MLENNSRRNNLRLLNVPEGSEGEDIKSFIATLIKESVQIDESVEDLKKDIEDPQGPFSDTS